MTEENRPVPCTNSFRENDCPYWLVVWLICLNFILCFLLVPLYASTRRKKINSDTDPMLYVQYFDKIIDIPEINTADIISVISSLSNSAAGYDEITASIMKQLIVYYVQPLTF